MRARNGGTKRLFAVVRTFGPNWDASAALDDQANWREHADFMDGLAEEGFVLLGGPLEGTTDVLLAVAAESAEQVAERLNFDPWTGEGLLKTVRIAPWTIRLGRSPT